MTKGKTEDTGAIRFMISENPQEVSMGGYGNDVLGGKRHSATHPWKPREQAVRNGRHRKRWNLREGGNLRG